MLVPERANYGTKEVSGFTWASAVPMNVRMADYRSLGGVVAAVDVWRRDDRFRREFVDDTSSQDVFMRSREAVLPLIGESFKPHRLGRVPDMVYECRYFAGGDSVWRWIKRCSK